MAGTTDKVVGALKGGGARVKHAAAKVHEMATDPSVQEKARKLAENGAKLYRAANSPEAKRAYRQASEFMKKTRSK